MASQNDLLKRYTEIRDFVLSVCSNFITNEKVLNALVIENDTTARMLSNFWVPAFTHITANPSNGRNNEVLENVGDSILDGQFSIFLTRRLPQGSELLYTELGNVYTSNEYLSGICDSLGMAAFLAFRGPPAPTEGMKADLIEAFVGALVMSGNALTDGLGSALAYEFVVFLYKDVELDLLKGEGASKTKVEQLFTRFGYNPPKGEYDRRGNVGVASVYLTAEHINFLQAAQFNFPTSDKLLIGTAQDKDKDKAVAMAFEQALNYLRSKGVTPTWAANLKNDKEMSDPSVKQYLPAAMRRASEGGFVSMYFLAPGKASTSDGFTILLVGVRDDGTRDTLHAKYFEYGLNRQSDSRERALARPQVIKEYAERV